jgi:D-glycero-D-manno-heptose 1,7-bisphosphate phosphatase
VSATRLTTVFLDRDGVINRRLPGDYVKSWSEFEFLPGAVEALAELRSAGLLTVVVTNQRGIARGLVSRESVDAVHQRMQRELEASDARVDAIYLCPDMDGPMRKPAPGMLLAAANDHALDLSQSVIVGDSVSDLRAGAAAGARCVLVAEGPERDAKLSEARDAGVVVDGSASSLLDAVRSVPLLRDTIAAARSQGAGS